MIGVSVLLDAALFKIPQDWAWPISHHGGGIIGWLLYWGSFNLLGNMGTILWTTGAVIIGMGAMLNMSWIGIVKQMLAALTPSSTINTQASSPKKVNTKVSPKIFSDDEFERKPLPLDTISDTTDSNFPISQADLIDSPNVTTDEAPIPETKRKKSNAPLLIIEPNPSDYQFPPIALLEPSGASVINSKENIKRRQDQGRVLEETLASFQVSAKVVNITPGPSITRFELEPGVGVKVAKITSLNKDLALKLAAPDVRIEAPIPGKALVGIEVPNAQTDLVTLRGLLEKTDFFKSPTKLLTGIGLTITGEPVLMDLAKMPHVLIAGATGAGKSVCVNGLILSILLKATPDEVKFLMIDPKKVELSLYEGIPHLVAPVVTDPHKAAATLNKWALVEMERRYEVFSKVGVKNIEGFNQWVIDQEKGSPLQDSVEQSTHTIYQKYPYIVVIIDELADLMMVASQEVENTICRLAQMSRATGIHLVIATQRPSVDVVTGLIKANVPSRVSFFLQSQIDSRTILDMAGAEKLLGKGDMLYSPVGSFKPQRVQGVYVSEKEVKSVVQFIKAQASPQYFEAAMEVEPLEPSEAPQPDQDELFEEAKQIIISTQYASTSYLQRKLRIGYNRAARLMEDLEKQGIVSQYASERRRTP